MFSTNILFICLFLFYEVYGQGVGSGTNGSLRLCLVEGRGTNKPEKKYCPILDKENSNIECVLGTDRLDCLRRMNKGTVDFGAFSPEDLVAAQWAEIDVLVTNELRKRQRRFARRIVAVVNKRILPSNSAPVSAILRNTTICAPIVDADDIRPLSDTLSQYLETLVTERSCAPELTMAENRIKTTADFFNRACRAGVWVHDKARDAELKSKYPSLCSACSSRSCSPNDRYSGEIGALTCLLEEGDVTWAEMDDVATYFKDSPTAQQFAYLCRDGSSQPITNNSAPCVWLEKPWPVIIAKRKVVEAVINITSTLSNSSVPVDGHWRGALANLLETHQALPEPLQPPRPPTDYLTSAEGFRDAYSQHGCNPPRHITLCTTSNLESAKCAWLSEAAAVFGVTPPLQCSKREHVRGCLDAVRSGDSDVVVADSDWLITADRNYSLQSLIHEATPIIEKLNTVIAYVRADSKITKIAELRGKRAAFPRFDGVAFHSVLRYIANKEKQSCSNAVGYFKEVCAPGVENYNISNSIKERYSKLCEKNGSVGELQALKLLIQGKTDVAFISMNTYRKYVGKQLQEDWANTRVNLTKVCPEENQNYCFFSWSSVGHVYTDKNITPMRKYDIINVFTKLEHLFGKNHIHNKMFSLYGNFDHQMDVIFSNNTKVLITNDMYSIRPYSEIPFSFERNLKNGTCEFSDFATDYGSKLNPTLISLVCLFLSLVLFR